MIPGSKLELSPFAFRSYVHLTFAAMLVTPLFRELLSLIDAKLTMTQIFSTPDNQSKA